MNITTVDNLVNDKITKKDNIQNNKLLPQQQFNCLMVGSTGSGKTTLLFNLLLKFLSFDKIYICSLTLDHPKYQWLLNKFKEFDEKEKEETVKNIKSEFKKQIKNKNISKDAENMLLDRILKEIEGKETLTPCDDLKDMPTVKDVNIDEHNIIIFDDLQNIKKKELIENYFSLGRNKNCSTFFLSQQFYKTSQVVRDNAHMIVIFRGQKENSLSRITRDITNPYESTKEFKNIIKDKLLTNRFIVLQPFESPDKYMLDEHFKPM